MFRIIGILLALGLCVSACSEGDRSQSESAASREPKVVTSTSNPTPRTARNGRQALLIGISKYRRGRSDNQDWWDLNATNDVDVMEQVLQERFGFKPEEIVVLRNKQATRQGILNAFNELVNATQENDVIYVHYSGHGQRVPDDTGEELDGWAQSIVPYDYKSRANPSQNIQNRDFRKFIAELKAKEPANVTLVFDSCFAGEMTKGGEELIRGEAWRGATPERPESGEAKFAKGPIGLFPPKSAVAEGYVVIGATRYDLVAQETTTKDGRKMGLLTYALVQATQNVRPPTEASEKSVQKRGSTYRDLFGVIKDVVTDRSNGRQSPQLEGEIDQVLLSGIIRRPSRFIDVSVPKTDSVTQLEAGFLQGVTKGSVYDLYPEGTTDFASAEPLAEAIVADVQLGTAVLTVTGAEQVDLHRSRAVERKHAYGDNRVTVNLQHLALYHPEGKILTESIENLDPVDAEVDSDKADLRVVRRGKDESVDRSIVGLTLVPNDMPWLMVRRNGSVAAAFADDDRLANQIELLIEDEARWRGIMNLRNISGVDPFEVEIEVVPVEVQLGYTGLVEKILPDKTAPFTDGNRLVMPEGEHVMIRIRVAETAPYDPYVAVLDLLPNGQISVLWPKREMKSASKKITADGEWHRFGFPFVWRIALPTKTRYGAGSYTPIWHREVFKVFATQTYLPMHLLADPPIAKGLNVKGMELQKGEALADLIRAAVGGSRADPVGVDPEYWSTSTAILDITPKSR